MVRKSCTLLVGFILVSALAAAAGPDLSSKPTYSKDVAPILNARCVNCHRPGEIGPMAFTGYKEVRPWARAIREAVLERRMPPWHADPKHGKFSNDRRLSEAEVQTISRWADAGAPEGDAKDGPPPPRFYEGWTIGKPDVEITMPRPFEVPATGVVAYQHMTTPTNFTEDKWVSAVEVRPGNREVVHHVIAFVLPPEGDTTGSELVERGRFGSLCNQVTPDAETLRRLAEQRGRTGGAGVGRSMGSHLIGWAPGLQAAVYAPGSAKLLRAGSRIMFQLHYTPNGKPAVDRETKVGLIFAKGPVNRTVHTMGIMNTRLLIPAGEPNYESTSCFAFTKDVVLNGFMPHMHLRGKDFTYRVTFPDGRSETLLSVPKYNFNWQTWYELETKVVLPKGTRIDCTAHFDNSANNRYNPDPTKEVRWGDQTWEEMMIGWITITADREPPPVTTSGGAN